MLIELLLRILSVNLPARARDLKSDLYKEYSIEELDLSIPFRHKNHGGECIKTGFRKKMQWHPRFGYNDILRFSSARIAPDEIAKSKIIE